MAAEKSKSLFGNVAEVPSNSRVGSGFPNKLLG